MSNETSDVRMSFSSSQLSPISEIEIPALKERLAAALTGSTILASTLGGIIIKEARALSRSISLAAYGGLRKFAQTYLEDLVAIKTFHGPGQAENYDILVGTIKKTIAPAKYKAYPFASGTQQFFWSAISNPRTKFLLRKQNDDLECVKRSDRPSGSANEEYLDPLSVDEYAQITKQFADSLSTPESIKEANERISAASPEILFQVWTEYLISHGDGSLFTEWQKFRAEKLIEIFKKKAELRGVNKEKIEHYSSILQRGDAKGPFAERRQYPKPAVSESRSTLEVPQIDCVRKTDARSLLQSTVIEIVLKMTDDQLRQLNLPLGLVLDAVPFMARKPPLDKSEL